MPKKYTASAKSNLVLTGSASRTRVHIKYVTTYITISSYTSPVAVLGCWISDQLTLTQTASLAGQHLFPSSNLTDIPLDVIIEAGTNDPDALAELFELYGLKQTVVVDRSITNISITHDIYLTQSTGHGYSVIASNHVHLSDAAKRAYVEECTDFILISQTLTGVNTRGSASVIALVDTATYEHIITQAIVSSLSLVSSALSGARSSTCPVPLTHRSTVQLYCNDSRLLKELTLELRNPEFGDNEQYETMRINRRSRGGTLHIYRDSTWPATQKLIYTFAQLSEKDKKDLLNFLEKTVGYQIQLTDFESRVWDGVITTPSADIRQHRKQLNSVTLQFEGTLT